MKNLLFVFLAFSVIASSQAQEPVKTADGTHFGEVINAKGSISYDQMLKKIEKKKELKNVKVEGKVEAVCQSKGCWMNIVSDDPSQKPMMVKFKDYGFFMPKDIAGQRVILKGMAYLEETSVDELRHYAEDAGKSAEEIASITEPKVELKFMADGVILK